MKKLLFIIFGVGLAIGARAQQRETIVKSKEKAELRHDIRVKRAHKKAVWHNLAKGKVKSAGKQQDVVNTKRKEIHEETKDLRAVGVKHPTHQAKKEIRVQNRAGVQ